MDKDEVRDAISEAIVAVAPEISRLGTRDAAEATKALAEAYALLWRPVPGSGR